MKKKTPLKFLIDKRATSFFATEELVAAIDSMRGSTERTPWIRSCVEKFLASDVRSQDHPDFPRYKMPERPKKILVSFEMSGEMSQRIEARRWEFERDPEARRAKKPGPGKSRIEPSMRIARFIKLAVIWYLDSRMKKTAQAKAEQAHLTREIDQLVESCLR